MCYLLQYRLCLKESKTPKSSTPTQRARESYELRSARKVQQSKLTKCSKQHVELLLSRCFTPHSKNSSINPPPPPSPPKVTQFSTKRVSTSHALEISKQSPWGISQRNWPISQADDRMPSRHPNKYSATSRSFQTLLRAPHSRNIAQHAQGRPTSLRAAT